MVVCRTFRITTKDGQRIALGAISAKQAEHFLYVMRPDLQVAMIEEIKPLPEDEPWNCLFIAIAPLVIFAWGSFPSLGATHCLVILLFTYATMTGTTVLLGWLLFLGTNAPEPLLACFIDHGQSTVICYWPSANSKHLHSAWTRAGCTSFSGWKSSHSSCMGQGP